MKKLAIALVLVLAAVPAFAQEQQTTPEQYQALIQSVRQQRDAANDTVAQLGAQLFLANKELTDLRAKIAKEVKP